MDETAAAPAVGAPAVTTAPPTSAPQSTAPAGNTGADVGGWAGAPAAVPPAGQAPQAFAWPEDLRVAAEAKGWDRLGGLDKITPVVARSYIDLEKVVGKMTHLPTKESLPETWDKFYNALGRPEKPEDYNITKPEGLPENFPYDEALIKGVLPDLHKLGLDNDKVNALWGLLNKVNVGALHDHEAEMARRAHEGEALLRREWGGEYDTRMALRDRVAQKYGGDEFSTWMKQYGFDRDPTFTRMLANIGKDMGEDGTTAGSGASAPGANPRAELDALISDKAFRDVMSGKDGPAAKESAQARFNAVIKRVADSGM